MTGEPRATRLALPGYGTPTHSRGLLSWNHVDERLASATRYWLATVTPSGSPHPVPVDGVWVRECLYIGGGPDVRWNRNLRANPRAAIHLESPDDVVILRGKVEWVTDQRSPEAKSVFAASKKKYGYGGQPPYWRFRPRVAVAWTNLAKDPTRWELGPG